MMSLQAEALKGFGAPAPSSSISSSGAHQPLAALHGLQPWGPPESHTVQ